MKQQRDLVTKRAPVSVLDLPGMERWLSGMAARGLFLERQASFSTQSFRFRRGTPRTGRRYRLCPATYGNTAPSEELLELYAAQGWQYVVCTSRGSICFHIFFHDDPAAPEPFTDTDSLIYALRTPIRRGVIALLSSGFSLLLALDFCHLRLGLGPVYRSGLATPWLFLCVCCLLLFLSSGTDLIMLLTFRRRFSQGLRTPIPLSVSMHRFQLLLGCSSALLFLLAIFSLSVTLGFSHSDLPLTNWDPDFSLLTLAEVEGGDGWTPDENRTVSPHGWPDATPLPPSSAFHTVTCNDVDIDRSLVRTRYFIDQSGSGARGRASMEVHYFIDPTARSAQSLLEELEQAVLSEDGYYSQLPASLPFQSAAVPGAEAFRFRRDGIHWEILAQKDRRALLLSYEGSRDLSQWFPQIAQMLTQTGEP